MIANSIVSEPFWIIFLIIFCFGFSCGAIWAGIYLSSWRVTYTKVCDDRRSPGEL